MRNYHFASVMLAGVILLAAARTTLAATDEGQNPGTAVVERLQNALLDVMKQGSKLDVNGRYMRLEPVITETHDFEFSIPRVFGEDWQRLTDAQKQTVAELYRRATIMTFAQQFNDYHGEQFSVVDEKPTARGDRLVRSVMRVPQGPAVHFDYLLRKVDGQWRIINTVFDGVSGLSMERARYQPLLQQRGADALIVQLRKAAAGQP
jgi:phospholipid transport system substrate-binding protein